MPTRLQVKIVCMYKVVHTITIFTKCLKPLLVQGEFLKAWLFSAIKRLTPPKILAFLYSIFGQEEVCFIFLDNQLSCNPIIFRSNWKTTICSVFLEKMSVSHPETFALTSAFYKTCLAEFILGADIPWHCMKLFPLS